MKWQPVSLRLATYKPDQYAALRKVLAHFFHTDDFQRWSLANHEQKIGHLWQSYKMPLKRYIHSFFPDAEYRQHKVKIPSLGRVSRQRPSRISDRESGVTLSIEKGSGDSCADSDGGE